MFKKTLLTISLGAMLLPLSAMANYGRDLDGTYLGVSRYKPLHRGPNRAATRIYLHEIEGERGAYHMVLLEYVNLLKMAPQYVAANKAPAVSKVIGYLKEITKKISVHKVVPTKVDGTLNIYPVKVDGDKIVAIKTKTPRKLILKPGKVGTTEGLEHSLSGAIITSNSKAQPDHIFFPMKNDGKLSGHQYAIAKTTYEKVGLNSTWRKDFLPGPYLSAYGRLNDEVLTLRKTRKGEFMNYVLNPEMASKKRSKREKMFTNKKSAFLQGNFESIEAADGMFIVKPIDANTQTINVLDGKIGLFIDIFDATEALNQDVVELVFVNTENPEDFLMYYEHPENGEGTAEKKN